jgi:aspartyl protease family protein
MALEGDGMRNLIGLGLFALICGAATVPLIRQLPASQPPATLHLAKPAEAPRERIVRVAADSAGHFTLTGQIEGKTTRLVLDTGASIIALTHEDGERIGARPRPGAPKMRISTANGVVTADQVRLNNVRIGDIVVHDVEAVVMPKGALSTNLLGMSFLKRIDKFTIDGSRLTLVN